VNLPDDLIERWREVYPAVDIEGEINKASDWCESAGAKGRKQEWQRFLSGWLRRARTGQDRTGGQDESRGSDHGWLPKGKVTEAMVETGYQALVDDYAMDGNTAGLVALELEWKGVPCHLCKTPYRKVEVRNPFGEFDYHVPNCRCFKSCPRLRTTDGRGASS